MLAGAMCVQRFDDSLNSAIHITYRISLRSSSVPEPRDPLLKVFTYSIQLLREAIQNVSGLDTSGRHPGKGSRGRGGRPAEATAGKFTVVWESRNSVMIPPLVHQRRPCYDFYFL